MFFPTATGGKNMQKLVTLLSVCGVAACSNFNQANNTNYLSELQRWVGRSEQQLYSSWGEPAEVFYVTPEEKVVTYITTSASGTPEPYENQFYYQGIDDDYYDSLFSGPINENQFGPYYCKTSFVIQDNIIINYNFNGDNCVLN